MPSAHAVRAGRAYVELYASTAELQRQFKTELNRVAEFAREAARVSRITITLSIAAAYPISRLVKDFADFDDKLKIVQATTRATGVEFQRLTDLTRQLGRETSFTAHEVASGMVQLGRAGFKPHEIEETLKHFLNLSRATATELPRAVDIATATLRGFNMESSQAQDIADVLTATANSSAQTLDDLGDSFKYIIPLANTASLSLRDAAKATAMLANLGIKGTMAATGMRNILLRMSLPNIQEIYRKELGVEVINQQTGALRTFSEVMDDVAKAIKNISGAKRLAIFRDLFGLYGLASGAALSSGVDFSDMFERIDNSIGEAQRVADKMDEGIGGAIRLTISKIRDIVFAIGDAISPQLKRIGTDISDATLKIISTINNNKGMFDDIIDVCMGFVSALKLVGETFLWIANLPGIKQIAKQFIVLSPVIYAITKSISVLGATVTSISKGFVGLTNGIFKLLYIKDHIKAITNNISDLKNKFLLFLDSLTGSQKLQRAIVAFDTLTAKQNRLKNSLANLWTTYNNLIPKQQEAYKKVKEAIAGIQLAANEKAAAESGLNQIKQSIANFPAWLKQHQDAYKTAAKNVVKYRRKITYAQKKLAESTVKYNMLMYLQTQGYNVPQSAFNTLVALQQKYSNSITQSSTALAKWINLRNAEMAVLKSSGSIRQGLINSVGIFTQKIADATEAGKKAYKEYRKTHSVFVSLTNALHAASAGITKTEKHITGLDFVLERLNKTRAKIASNLQKAFVGATLIGVGTAAIVAFTGALVAAIAKAHDFKEAIGGIEATEERIAKELETIEGQNEFGKSEFARLKQINDEIEESRAKGLDYTELMDEAKSIISSIANDYGDLGLSIDETTGKVLKLVEAEREYDKIMAKRKSDALKESAKTSEEHAKTLRDQAEDMIKSNRSRIRNLQSKTLGTGPVSAQAVANAMKAFPEFVNGERVFYNVWGNADRGIKEKYNKLIADAKSFEFTAERTRREADLLISETRKAVEEQNDPIKSAIYRAEGFESDLADLSKELLGEDSKEAVKKNTKELIKQLDEKVQGVFVNRLDALDLLNDKDLQSSGLIDEYKRIRESNDYQGAVDFFQKLLEGNPKNTNFQNALTVSKNALEKSSEISMTGAIDDIKSGVSDSIKKSLISADEEVRQKLESAGETVNKSKVENLSTLDKDVKDYRNAEINYYKEQYNRAKELRSQLVQYANSVKTAQESVGPEFENVRTMYQELANTIAEAIEKARSTEEEAADKIESNREALKEDLKDTGKVVKDDIERSFGTFNGIEAIDALYGGNNSLMEYEKKKTRFLDSLDRTLQKFFSAYSNYDGEYV